MILIQYELNNSHKFVFSIQPLAKFVMSRSQIFTNHNSPLIKTSDGSLVVSTKAGRNCFATHSRTKKHIKFYNFVPAIFNKIPNRTTTFIAIIWKISHTIGHFWLDNLILGNIRTAFGMEGKIFALKNIPLSTVREYFEIVCFTHMMLAITAQPEVMSMMVPSMV